ncbi:DnaJ-like protein subfamily C member 3 [Oopsacas minuta]|uniref:DnaJ-like protein subfamily C member 3 n=1 Tax=Oopsacas minuta TaxID=111878 RepID=A0AAV7K6H4_9METZ|nr:DnaJ-like protein subfamily C member 3 [Oopsacas minuta]
MNVFFVLTLLSILFQNCNLLSRNEVDEHLLKGKEALTLGRLDEALSHFHSAIDGDPNNFLTHYRRATVYLAMGRVLQAMVDFTSSLQINPEFTQARFQRALLYVKQGKSVEAGEDLALIPDDHEGLEDIRNKLNFIKERRVILSTTKESDYTAIREITGSILDISPWDTDLRLRRAFANELLERNGDAVADLRVASVMLAGDTLVLLRLSLLHYSTGELTESLNSVRECLRLDPDDSACFKHYKKAKKLNKQLETAEDLLNQEKYPQAAAELERSLSTETEVTHFIFRIKARLCHTHRKLGVLDDVLKWCKEALELQPNDINVICDRADQYIDSDMLDEAMKDFRNAKEIDPHFKRAADGLDRVLKLQKQAGKRDYYKILGVKRTAGKKEIMKAYRQLAQEWHPDMFPDPIEKERAEKKFIDIAAAKEVLTNKEKREKYDRGEDPLDPENGKQHHWHQGPHHGFPFGGGGGGFSFKFNF